MDDEALLEKIRKSKVYQAAVNQATREGYTPETIRRFRKNWEIGIAELIKQDREAQASGRLLSIKRIRAKARIAVYHEVEQNWNKPSFKKYILELHDQDLKILERQLTTNSEAKI